MRPYTRGSLLSPIGGFYMRRAFRVLPAYLMVLLFYFAIPCVSRSPRALTGLAVSYLY